ncbi:LysR family transcriptional regulator [Noviherbaspirillum sp.]|uniref:LysR family transcriptional regulator n=1 Tax=Noviherbaspirillum sp. TaxID=1926288 RepID=UPI002D60BED3|nr:LysR substrate-binding domain-containing protein [Noviherbaspirillum sp.]HZW21020.1 LysR substrate-binding domain-containing protein [Noviherbaspirillum sp.]
MRNIDLDSLHIFKAVVDYGGITKAASQLNRVQSNITTRVKNLEDRLGVKLFQRQGGKLVLSPEGTQLLSYADRLLRLASEAEASLRQGTPRGTLRIGTMESTAAARLPPLLSRYHQRFPEVQIELVTGTSGALIGRVLRFEVEAAFVAEPFTATGLDMQEAFREELVLITPKNSPPVKTPKDLSKHTLIAFTTGCSYRRILEEWLGMSSIVPDRVLELGSYHAIVACVAAGSGGAIVPRSVLAVVHAENEVAAYPLPERVARAKTWLVWREGHQSVALDALKGELQKQKR